jgi:hypothetical protein
MQHALSLTALSLSLSLSLSLEHLTSFPKVLEGIF